MVDDSRSVRLPEHAMLPAGADATFDRIAALTRRVLGVPTALVSLVDQRRQVFPGAVGLREPWQTRREAPLSHFFGQYVVRSGAELIVADARSDPILAGKGAVDDLGFVAYAGMPVRGRDGTVIGSLCAMDADARDWTAAQVADLRDLAASCSTELQLREAATAALVFSDRAESLIAAMPVGYIAYDTQWRVSAVNAEAARIVDSTVDALLGRVLWDLFPATVGSEFETIYRRVAASGAGEAFEYFYPDPLNRWYEIRVQRDGQGLSVYFVDVTGRHTIQALQDKQAEHDRTVAHALQEALLTDLPRVDGIQLAARYLTAAGTERVGGDWYDAVVQPSGALAVSIGDVCGHGIEAAANMGELRAMLRGFLWDDGRSPARGVSRLDRAVQGLDEQVMGTLIAAFVETAANGDVSVRWTNAGHPPPIVLLPDGTTRPLASFPELMLGAAPGVDRSDHTYPLSPGSTLLLYTDGLIESPTESLADGARALRDALSRHAALDVSDLLDAILRELRSDARNDDVAVLVARIGAPADATSDQPPLALASDVHAPATARAHVAKRAAALPSELVECAELLVSELVTNAVRHGEPVIIVSVELDPTGLTVSVHDGGNALPALSETPPGLRAASGRGLAIVDALASAWGVRLDPSGPGKAVWFRLDDSSQPLPG